MGASVVLIDLHAPADAAQIGEMEAELAAYWQHLPQPFDDTPDSPGINDHKSVEPFGTPMNTTSGKQYERCMTPGCALPIIGDFTCGPVVPTLDGVPLRPSPAA